MTHRRQPCPRRWFHFFYYLQNFLPLPAAAPPLQTPFLFLYSRKATKIGSNKKFENRRTEWSIDGKLRVYDVLPIEYNTYLSVRTLQRVEKSRNIG